jgi:hypothetical protein
LVHHRVDTVIDLDGDPIAGFRRSQPVSVHLLPDLG